MKNRMLSLLLSLVLLTGCTSMLDRNYVSVEPHDQFSEARTDSSTLRAENYQGLVTAILYLVSQGTEAGVIRLYNYTRDVDADLSSACLEVTKEDPLGAYAVDYIKYDFSRIISYYEANVKITYRRTAAQIKSVVSVTGSSAIKGELSDALTRFCPEIVLRVSYLAENEDYIVGLVRQAYYDTPGVSFGLPDARVTLYPESGTQRVVEILLTYSESTDTLRQKRNALAAAAEACAANLSRENKNPPDEIFRYLRAHVSCQAEDGKASGSAYAALVDGKANSEGIALAYQLLCGITGVESVVVCGTKAGEPHFWNLVKTDGGWLHVDAAWTDGLMLDDKAMQGAGYGWNAESYPASGGETGT